jgi:hypothetical protein
VARPIQDLASMASARHKRRRKASDEESAAKRQEAEDLLSDRLLRPATAVAAARVTVPPTQLTRRPRTANPRALDFVVEGGSRPLSSRRRGKRMVFVGSASGSHRVRVNVNHVSEAGDVIRLGGSKGLRESELAVATDPLDERLRALTADETLVSQDQATVLKEEARLRLLRSFRAHGWKEDPEAVSIRRDQQRRYHSIVKATRERVSTAGNTATPGLSSKTTSAAAKRPILFGDSDVGRHLPPPTPVRRDRASGIPVSDQSLQSLWDPHGSVHPRAPDGAPSFSLRSSAHRRTR